MDDVLVPRYVRPSDSLRELTEETEPVFNDPGTEVEYSDIQQSCNEDIPIIINEIKNLKLPTTRPWYEEKYNPVMSKFLHNIQDISVILSLPNVVLKRKVLVELYKFLYDLVIDNIEIFSDSLPEAEGGLDNGLITKVYCVTCLTMLNLNTPQQSKLRTSEIKFCTFNNLSISKTKISRYNMEELLCALNILGNKWHTLGYSIDLKMYLDALEWRISEIMLNAYSDETHNVISERCFHSKTKQGVKLYTCNSECEYRLCAKIISFRKELLSAIPDWRVDAYTNMEKLGGDVTDENVENLSVNISMAIHNLHGDKVSDSFIKQYFHMSVTTYERIVFMKMHPEQTKVNPQDAIVELRTEEEFKHIRAKTQLNISKILLDLNDKIAVSLIIHLIMQELLYQYLNLDWLEYTRPKYKLMELDQLQADSMISLSYKTPLYVHSMNEACIMWESKMYVFGPRSRDYVVALFVWLRIVCSKDPDFKTDFGKVCNPADMLRALLCFNIKREDLVAMIDKKYVETLAEQLNELTMADIMNSTENKEKKEETTSGWKDV